MNHRPPKKSLKQKLAVALSVVNALNVCAPMALPYVNVAKNVRADGGQAEPLSDGLARAFYGTAQAEGPGDTTTVGPGQEEPRETVESGGKQVIEGGTGSGAAGGVGSITNLNHSGSQVVNSGVSGGSGGTGIVTNMNNGGWQDVNFGGTSMITTMNGGTQDVHNGATGSVNVMSGGWQNVSGGTGTVSTMSSGTQYVAGGTGTVSTMNGGRQNVVSGGNVTVGTMNGGRQDISDGCTGTVATMSGGEQIVWGGNGTVATMSGGTQKVYGGATGTVATMSGGTQIVNTGGTGTVHTLNNGGTQIVYKYGTTKNTRVKDGGVIEENGEGATMVNGGTFIDVEFDSSGVHRLVSGATRSGETVSGHILEVGNGGTAINITVSNGGTQNVLSGGVASGGTINNGGKQNIASGGIASGATINNSGSQTVSSGGTATAATVSSGGVQSVLSGGVASGGTINSGGVQNIASGGTASGTTINNSGSQTVSSGGTATATTVNSGGTITVEDYATAQIDEANGGVLHLSDLGLAEAQFGALGNQATVNNYNLTTLYARGDNVHLGLSDDSNHSGANKTLHIVNMDGYANFIVNTDLRNNKSDLIKIETAANATKPNTVQINHDPTLAKGEEVTSASATVATVGSGTATFVGVKSTINSIDYLPEIETIDGGRTWVIRRVMKTANDAAHSAVMGSLAGMATLSTGNDFIGAATEGLSLTANEGRDGVAAFAKMGGGSLRQETGSHVDVNTWNAILALGYKNRKESKTEECNASQSDSLRITNSKSPRSQEFLIGAFFEYGSGNYTTVDGDNRGDGSVRNTGGGVLAKWTAAHGLYVEGSLRAGTVKDDARDVLKDNAGNGYSYETDAGYFGAHLGVGKEIPLANGNVIDVYGKFFYNRKNSVSFSANNSCFDLDAVTSRVLRVGARYTVKREKWNFYGGVAYEHEFDGVAEGTVEGLPIRSADIKGGSFRAEIGATMKPDENSPWQLDLNMAGFAGKKQGFSGGVSVSFMF